MGKRNFITANWVLQHCGVNAAINIADTIFFHPSFNRRETLTKIDACTRKVLCHLRLFFYLLAFLVQGWLVKIQSNWKIPGNSWKISKLIKSQIEVAPLSKKMICFRLQLPFQFVKFPSYFLRILKLPQFKKGLFI